MPFFKTNTADYAALIARLTLGIIILPHGLQKTFGLFGGPGYSATMQFLGSQFSAPVGFLVILGESLGALALIFGFLTRFCAASIGIIMLGAIVFVTGKNGFFLPSGYEFSMLAIGIALSLVVSGGGAFAVDSYLGRKE